ncbi:glycosyltransferase Alg8 [Devosia sp. UYZn731]|uniref:glycosyltransferase n=1 Tax=Devosia sp. UYZn731 TaxID=3156345 RepID=UPI00339A74FE
MSGILSHAVYILVCLGIALSIPGGVLGAHGALVITLGAVGAWRYLWAATNFVRAQIYSRWAYPRWRGEAEQAYAQQESRAHAYFLVTSYKVEQAISMRVYRSVFAAAARSEGGATVVASVVDIADERLIRSIFGKFADVSGVKLIIDRIPGTGKRDALATALDTIAGELPSTRDIVLFVDGDTIVPVDIVARSAPFFTDRRIGALTTDEMSETTGSPLFRDWFSLRFNQRQMMMCSMALGRRVLTLTGRMSVIRADLATDKSFIDQVGSDFIDHWRLGRVNFLTGDDKSTWYWLLRHGFQMAYLPDVQSISMETQPRAGFIDSATTLMIRWFGNMLRTNGRAMALSPRQIGLFTWWSILDQRVSMWTTLAGPIAVVLTALFVDPAILPAYFAWVMATRYVSCWLLASFRGPFPITYPFLLYFGQILGSVIKSYVVFRIDRQKWTRQATSIGTSVGISGQARAMSSIYMHALALGWLITAVLLLSRSALNPLI